MGCWWVACFLLLLLPSYIPHAARIRVWPRGECVPRADGACERPDHLIANNGWANFTLPACLAPGQYLLRAEIIALHSAYSQGGAQFYTSCGQLSVGGSGTLSPSTVSFPGAYKAADPGITINIYGPGGVTDNGGKAYVAPGPAVVAC